MDGLLCLAAPRRQSLSLIIPAYNEEASIRQAIEEANQALAEWTDDYEILVVDDGSTDSTARLVADLAQSLPRVRLLGHAKNRGYGTALRTGFEAARFDRIAFTDADCQFHLADLISLVDLANQHPVAVGYRVHRQDSWKRRFFSWGYNTLIRVLLDTRVRDCDCALKVFRREALQQLLPETEGFFVNTEMLTRARLLGYEVVEVSVRHRPRLHGTSKVSLWDIPRTLAALLPFWWSRFLFPGESAEVQSARAPKGTEPASASVSLASALGILALLFAATLLFFSRLDCPLQEPEEPRYAEIPRQMLERGDGIVPTLQGLPYYDKPPLLYWLVMASYKLCGIQDWSARLVSSGAAFLCVLVTYLWGRHTLGLRPALVGAFVLCLSGRFVYLGRLVTMNSLLCLFVVAALAAGHVALSRASLRWRWWLLSAAATGLGLLTKGPVALVLAIVPLLAFSLLDPRTARPGARGWLGYLVISCGLACPWYLAVASREPEFLGYFFWKHNLVRFVAPFDHVKPLWFFLPEILLGMLPWSLLFLPLVRFLCSRSASQSVRRPQALGFFLLASLWTLVFFSLSGSKRAGYILPVMPPLALALGYYLDLILAGVLAQQETGHASQLWSRRAFRVSLLCGGITFAALFLALQLFLPWYGQRFSLRAQIWPYATRAQDPSVPVVCYPRAWDSVSFYLQRSDVRVYATEQRAQLIADLGEHPRTLAFIKCDRSLSELLHDLPGSLEFVPQGSQAGVVVGWVRQRWEVPPTLLASQ